MAKTLRAYLLKQFLSLLALTTLALCFLFLVFDLLAQSDKILAGGMPVWQAIPLYSGLRMPQIISLVLPIAAMLAVIATYAKLHNNHEATAMTSAGIRLVRVVGVFFLGALIVAILHFVLINTVLLKTSVHLRLWQENDFGTAPRSLAIQAYPAWFDTGPYIAYANSAADEGNQLFDIRLIKRNPLGIMETYITAPKMAYQGGTTWHILTPEIRKTVTAEVINQPELVLDLEISPTRLATANKQIEEMTLPEIWALMQADQLSNRENFYYETWFWRRFSQPLSTVVMMLIATPLLFVKPRQHNKVGLTFSLLTLGFLFFIGERITLAIGEAGDTSPLAATWGLPSFFLVILFSYLLWRESPKGFS